MEQALLADGVSPAGSGASLGSDRPAAASGSTIEVAPAASPIHQAPSRRSHRSRSIRAPSVWASRWPRRTSTRSWLSPVGTTTSRLGAWNPETSIGAAIRRLGQELARLEPVVDVPPPSRQPAPSSSAREVRDRAMATRTPEEAMAGGDRSVTTTTGPDSSTSSRINCLPHYPNDNRDVIMEIRAGAGRRGRAVRRRAVSDGHVRYAERYKYAPELLSLSETGIGGAGRRRSSRSTATGRTAGSSSKAASIASSASRRPSRRAGSTPRRSRSGDARGRRGRDRDRRGARSADRRQKRSSGPGGNR